MKFIVWFICIVLNWNVQANYSLTDLIAIVINTHPQIKSSEYSEKSALVEVESAKWQYYPRFDLSLKKVKASKSDVNYFADDKVGVLSISQPLYQGGALDANLNKAKANLDMQLALKKQKKV